MAERLAGGNTAVALLANTIAISAALISLILTFGPISGAHLNPVVTLAFAARNNLGESVAYILAQVAGAMTGVVTANLMFGLPPIFLSRHARSGVAQFLSECVATMGLLFVIRVCVKFQPRMIALAVAAYIAAAIWFTPSTSFANPAVTLARSFTDTFTGIRPIDVPAFILAQLIGLVAAIGLTRWLVPGPEREQSDD
jgi:glycerol uptake facilitator-like aquaporin